MNRKHLLALPLAAMLLLTGCTYDPVSKDNIGGPVPGDPVQIEPGIEHKQTSVDKRAPVPQDCKQQGLLGQYWREGSTTLGLQGDLGLQASVASIRPVASNCYDLVQINSRSLEYPGINIRYIDNQTLDVSVRMSEGQAAGYSFTADDSYGVLQTIENVSSDGNLHLRIALKSHAPYAVEYNYDVPFGSNILVYVAH